MCKDQEIAPSFDITNRMSSERDQQPVLFIYIYINKGGTSFLVLVQLGVKVKVFSLALLRSGK